jgi:hypothetical protein
MKHTRNIYFAYKEVNTTLEYRIIVNVEENKKSTIYKLEEDGYKIVKVLANE